MTIIGIDPGSKRFAIVSVPNTEPATWTPECVVGSVLVPSPEMAKALRAIIDATIAGASERGESVSVVVEWSEKPFIFRPRKGASGAEIAAAASKSQAVMAAREIMLPFVAAIKEHCAERCIACNTLAATSARKYAGVLPREKAPGLRPIIDDIAVKQRMAAVLAPEVFAKLVGDRGASREGGRADVLDAAVAVIGYHRRAEAEKLLASMPGSAKRKRGKRKSRYEPRGPREPLPCGCSTKHHSGGCDERHATRPPKAKAGECGSCARGHVAGPTHRKTCSLWTKLPTLDPSSKSVYRRRKAA